MAGESRGRRIVICYPEMLLGQAVAAALADIAVEEPHLATSPEQLLAHAREDFDLAIVSDSVGDELGELLEALMFRNSNLPVLVLCRNNDFRAAAQALEWGAVGSVSSASSISTLTAAVLTACEGHVVFLDGAADRVRSALAERSAERGAADALFRSLSTRERTLVDALARGRTTGEISRDLCLSPHTVRAAIRKVGTKLDAQGQLQIAAASRYLLRAVSPPSKRFVALADSLRTGPRAG